MKEKNYTVYVALKGRKHYLVFSGPFSEWPYHSLVSEGSRYFRCGEMNLEIEKGWILKDELYFDDPGKGAKVVSVVSHWRKR